MTTTTSGSIGDHTLEAIDHVDGVLNFLADQDQKPVTYMYEPPQGVAPRSGDTVKRTIPIYDARAIAGQMSLDREGFAVVRQESSVADFYDEHQVRAIYYGEVERLVREHTGAVKVHVFDHNVRYRPMAERREKKVQAPVKFAHNDYTLASGPQRVRDLLPDQAEALLKNRFAIVNVWRPIRGPVEDTPLAVCDAQSMTQADFVKHQLKYQDRVGEIYSVAFNPKHRWYYISKQRKEEVLLLKCYDSDSRHARFTAHSAFADPTSPPDAAPRESIEVRTLVFYGPERS